MGKRKTNTREQKPTILIVCEGKKTERIYFNNYKRRDNNVKIEILYCSDSGPQGLVNFALDKKIEKDINTKYGDRIWCVLDVDDNTDATIQHAVKIARRNKIDICLSNPCFEIWYLIHYEYRAGCLSRTTLFNRLRNYITNYEKNKDYFIQLKPLQYTAINNAKRLEHHHNLSDNPILSTVSNPSSCVYKLIEILNNV